MVLRWLDPDPAAPTGRPRRSVTGPVEQVDEPSVGGVDLGRVGPGDESSSSPLVAAIPSRSVAG